MQQIDRFCLITHRTHEAAETLQDLIGQILHPLCINLFRLQEKKI